MSIVDGIGSTEMMHIFISESGDAIRPGSTGRAVPGYEATVLDADGQPLAEGEGRLAVKGPTGCRYLDDPRQVNYVENGWNLTGDTYRKDGDGYFWYVARSDDMIVSSGYNIGAPEVENALLAHPAVAECAVIGVPCPERGQKVKAFVVAAANVTAERCSNFRTQEFREGNDCAIQISPRNRVRRGAAEDGDGEVEAGGACGTASRVGCYLRNSIRWRWRCHVAPIPLTAARLSPVASVPTHTTYRGFEWPPKTIA